MEKSKKKESKQDDFIITGTNTTMFICTFHSSFADCTLFSSKANFIYSTFQKVIKCFTGEGKEKEGDKEMEKIKRIKTKGHSVQTTKK